MSHGSSGVNGPRPVSFWNTRVVETDYARLEGDLAVDVAVIGGGIAGMTAAVLLKRSGRRVALLEARRVGRQVTGHSNAKLTSQHSLIYADLIERLGEDAAQHYADANQAALQHIATWVAEHEVDCDFERKPAYCFTQAPDRVERIEAEFEAATQLGLPASLHGETDLPYPVQAALRFDDQAQLNPTAYVCDLAAQVAGDASHVFERSRVLEVEEGEPCAVRTEHGTVRADEVVVATNLPFVPQGEFYKKASPRAHVVVAASIDPRRAPVGMYLSIDPPTHSIRTAPFGEQRVLIAVGESFAPGTVTDTEALYRELRAFVRDRFGVEEFVAHWANMDYDSQDRVPFVGRASTDNEHLWVATGFGSWGISGGTAAGMMLADAIMGRDNRWAGLFDATRMPGEAENRGQPAMRQGEPADPRPGSWDELGPGEGAVFQHGEDNPVAAYRDEAGSLHMLSAHCTHLGCHVHWNNANRTWDCECHGSTFEPEGTVIHGPAVQPLGQHRTAKG
jgi:glycine/D-amino acid oxidase-like deaminating enzyme/nitrite reductase/ring-hydroxylating ferredoxin subunit